MHVSIGKKCYNRDPTDLNEQSKQDSIKAVVRMRRNLQRNFINDAITASAGDASAMWKALKRLWPNRNEFIKLVLVQILK